MGGSFDTVQGDGWREREREKKEIDGDRWRERQRERGDREKRPTVYESRGYIVKG